MKKYLSDASKAINLLDWQASVRRTMWMDFEERLEICFSELVSQPGMDDSMGRLYLSTSKTFYGPAVATKISRVKLMNHAQIFTGWRFLGFSHKLKLKEDESSKIAVESGAALCFSQLANGNVNVTLYPYKSDLSSMGEEFILLAINIAPLALTTPAIKKCIRIFLRNCVATSAVSFGNFGSYIYRTKLSFYDFRYRKIQQGQAFVLIEKITLIALAALGVWATFYTSGKLPTWLAWNN